MAILILDGERNGTLRIAPGCVQIGVNYKPSADHETDPVRFINAPKGLRTVQAGEPLHVLHRFTTTRTCPLGPGKLGYVLENDIIAVFTGDARGIAWFEEEDPVKKEERRSARNSEILNMLADARKHDEEEKQRKREERKRNREAAAAAGISVQKLRLNRQRDARRAQKEQNASVAKK